jgi:hypothetical protein
MSITFFTHTSIEVQSIFRNSQHLRKRKVWRSVITNSDLVFEYLGNNTASIAERLVRIPLLTEEVCENSLSVFNSKNYINEK